MLKSKVLFILTGSIACYKACHVISRLVQNNCDVQVVATTSALQFIGTATLEGLTGNPVISDMYARGHVMEHIHLMRWADLILVAPATASFINKAAQGVGDDLVQTLFLAHDFKKPFLIAPAMNTSMYFHPVTQKSLEALKNMGLQILETASGVLACGETGYGKLLDPEIILSVVEQELKKSFSHESVKISPKITALQNIKILVTAGGTQEPLDTVRVLTNLSSGKTGISIAEYLTEMGFDVTLLQSHNSAKSKIVSEAKVFTSFANLDEQIRHLLSVATFTHVIHTAAVSDYSVANIEIAGHKYQPFEVKKLSSDADTMSIHLKRNHKIVDQLKVYSANPHLKVVAFKLTSQASDSEKTTAVEKLFKNSNADYVVHNDMTDIDVINGTHTFTLNSKTEKIFCENLDRLKSELAQIILPKDLV